MHLGSLGTPRPPVEMTFDYFGEVIRVHPNASDLQFFELIEKATKVQVDEVDVAASVEAATVVLTSIREQIHPDDWERFWRTAKANRQSTLDLMQLSEKITEATAGFPTTPSSASADGQPDTGTRSEDGSSSRRRQQTQRRALKVLKGRPDLQMAVVLAEEARAAVPA